MKYRFNNEGRMNISITDYNIDENMLLRDSLNVINLTKPSVARYLTFTPEGTHIDDYKIVETGYGVLKIKVLVHNYSHDYWFGVLLDYNPNISFKGKEPYLLRGEVIRTSFEK